jgi:hypothetical protein
MAADTASFSATDLPERMVTVKSGMKFLASAEPEAVCFFGVLLVIVAAKVAATAPPCLTTAPLIDTSGCSGNPWSATLSEL